MQNVPFWSINQILHEQYWFDLTISKRTNAFKRCSALPTQSWSFMYHLAWFTTYLGGHPSFRSYSTRTTDHGGQCFGLLGCSVTTDWMVGGNNNWRAERFRCCSDASPAFHKGPAPCTTPRSLTFCRSRTASAVLHFFKHPLKAFPGSFEEIDSVMEWWEWQRITIYSLTSAASPSFSPPCW